MIQEQLAHLPEFLPGYRPFPPAKERTAWQGLPLRAKQRFLQAGEAALQTPIAPLPLSLWLDFTHTGRRTPWETAYFSRRARLCALVSAECVEHEGRFLGAIADTVWAICEESAWQLPAHNSYIRDTPQLPLPDTTRPIVDLFAAETGALLALTRYLLPDELDAAAPGITARMERELDARILTPYFTSHFWWMGNGEEPMCNWTSWCTQNVLLTVFLLPTTQQQRQVAFFPLKAGPVAPQHAPCHNHGDHIAEKGFLNRRQIARQPHKHAHHRKAKGRQQDKPDRLTLIGKQRLSPSF